MADRDVKVSFIGDTSDLTKRLDDLERSVQETSEQIDDVAKSSGRFAGGLDMVGEAGDNTERRFRGLKDSITGTGDVMKGLRDGDILTFAQGMADLGGAMADLGQEALEWGKKALDGARDFVAAHGAAVVAQAKDMAAAVAHRATTIASTVATQAQAAAQWVLNAAMEANPIMLVVVAIAALVAGLVLAYQHSETFRNIVDAVGRALRDGFLTAVHAVEDAVGAVASAVQRAEGIVSDIVGVFVRLPGRIIDGIGDLGGKIWRAVQAGLEWVRDSAFPALLDAWLDLYVRFPLRVLEGIGDLGAKLWGSISGGMSELVSNVKGKLGEMLDAVTELPGKLGGLFLAFGVAGIDLGSSFVRGILSGIRGIAEGASDFASGFASAIRDVVNTQVIDRINSALDFTVSTGPLGSLPGIPDSIHFNPPDIPHLAAGGIVKARPGGTLALIAEAGQDEAVVPLGRGGALGGVTIHMPITIGSVASMGVADYAAQTIASSVRRTIAASIRGSVS